MITKNFLLKEYINNKKSINTIAKEMGKSYNFIWVRLIKFNISRRKSFEHFIGKKRPEHSKKMSGNKTLLYKDGRSIKKGKTL